MQQTTLPVRTNGPQEAHLEWVRPPQQLRSQQTMERLLDAAEQLLVEQGIDATGVSQVARRARSSVGAFYARFADRDALMRSVFERFAAQARATMDSALAPERWAHASMHDAMQTLTRFLLQVTRERQQLVGSMVTCACKDAAVSALVDGLVEHLNARLFALLEARGELPPRPDPQQAIAVLSGTLLAVAQGRVLRPAGAAAPIDDGQLAQELSAMAAGYLGLRQGG